MTDNEAVERVREAARALNDATAEAAKLGIESDVRIDRLQSIGTLPDLPIVSVTLKRTL